MGTHLKIILLPGLDGTGLLFKGLLEALPDDLEVDVICLNDLSARTYNEQAIELAAQYVGTDLVLVAESYSGRLAYEWCGVSNAAVHAVVFLASFVSAPLSVSGFASYLPLSLLKPHRLDRYLVNRVGFAGVGAPELIDQVFESIRLTDQHKFKQRLKNISQLNTPSKIYNIPSVYIRPSDDYLVANKAVAAMTSVFNNLKVVRVSGGHFIAQSSPTLCSNIIQKMATID